MNKLRTLIILRGLPGAGKSTFANFIWESSAIFEADKYFYDKDGNYNFDASKLHQAHKWCQDSVKQAMLDNILSRGHMYPEIIVSNTTTTEKELEPYLELAKLFEYHVVSLVVENRHGNVSTHNVPAETLLKMEARFEIKL